MAGFIHGEVSRVDRPTGITANVRRMIDAARFSFTVYRERFLERLDNPLIDVSVLLAEQDHQWRAFSSPNGFSPPPPDYPVGAGSWLAWTRLLPP